jgi:hypothetical protein
MAAIGSYAAAGRSRKVRTVRRPMGGSTAGGDTETPGEPTNK